MKLPPFKVNVKFPVFMVIGLTPVSTGVGFHSVTALVPWADVSAALMAVIVTEFC